MKTKRNLRSLSVVLTALLSVAVGGDTARPCGGLLTASSADAAIEGQRALVVWREETVDVYVQLQLQGSASDAMWLIPVGTTPELSVGSAELFTELADISAPTVMLSSPSDGGGGCLGASDAKVVDAEVVEEEK